MVRRFPSTAFLIRNDGWEERESCTGKLKSENGFLNVVIPAEYLSLYTPECICENLISANLISPKAL